MYGNVKLLNYIYYIKVFNAMLHIFLLLHNCYPKKIYPYLLMFLAIIHINSKKNNHSLNILKYLFYILHSYFLIIILNIFINLIYLLLKNPLFFFNLLYHSDYVYRLVYPFIKCLISKFQILCLKFNNYLFF